MSRHTIYKCDQCKREIGAKPHITLVLNLSHSGTGIAVPPTHTNGLWKTNRLNDSFLQFHDGKCIAAYFDGLLKKASTKRT